MKYSINLYGEGIRIYRLELTEKQFKQFSNARQQLSWEEMLLDLHFMNEMGIHHWKDLAKDLPLVGLKITPKSRIEIRANGRKKRTIIADEIVEHTTLFPIYAISNQAFNKVSTEKEFIVVEHETGLIQSLDFETTDFELSDLTFKIISFENEEWLVGMDYKKMVITSKKSDTVVTGLFVMGKE